MPRVAVGPDMTKMFDIARWTFLAIVSQEVIFMGC